MLLILHIVVALASMAVAATAFVRPSGIAIAVAYMLTAAMLASGTALTIAHPGHLVAACVAGVLCLAIIGTAVFAAQRRLSAEKVPASDKQ